MGVKCSKCHTENPSDSKFCKECATPLPSQRDIPFTETLETPTEELTRGTTFASRYEIIEELGKGGMGKVYRAEDKKIKGEIALKLIKPEIASDKKTIERFSNELKMARMISHRNVCRMFDLGEEKGAHYITMEYVRGEDLKSMIRMSGQLGVGTAINIAKQVCEGLTEAHRLGVIHRDLKSQNIMIDKDGSARIMDFGIARSIRGKVITGTGVMIGTPEYMSPEQVEGKEVDQRSDIYSLGVILYEMVTGKVPFEGDTPFTVGVRHKSEMPRNPRDLNSQIPEDLNLVILRCLEKDREKRYQSAGEVRSGLIRIEKDVSTIKKFVPKRKLEKVREINWRNFIFFGVAAVLMILIIVVALNLFTGRRKAINTIAVLPFAYAGDDLNMEYLSDGMTESIINNLSQLTSLKKVIAFSSVIRYKGKDIDPKDVGRELGVDAVLISRMIQRANELSIRVELVKILDNSRIWGNQYKLNVSKIFDVQEEISNAITENLRLKIAGEEKKRLTKRYTDNTEAYEAYLKGRFYWNKRTKDGLMKGLEYFNKAIEKDPAYALAYSGLADSYALLARYSYLSPDDAMPKGKVAAQKALEIDNTLSEAHTSLAFIERYYDFDWLEAESEYKKSIELNPNYATAHHWYALLLTLMGHHDKAIVEIKRAQELDPLSIIINTNVGWVYYFARQYDQAIEQFLKTLDMDPNFAVTHLRLGRTYIQKGSFEEGIRELQKAVSLSPESTEIIAALGHGYAISGKKNETLKIIEKLNELEKDKYVSSYDRALIHLALGEKDKTYEYLEKAFREKSSYLTYIGVDPKLDNLGTEPRFRELLKRMNLE